MRVECAEVTDRLWEYLDGELAAEEAAAVDRHLAACSFCRMRHSRDRSFLVLLVQSLHRPCPAPAPLRLAIRARLAGFRFER
ncbi:MAG: zf-HC2 domain-containing protein [Gemmatimonadales bacterium]|nr:zf-HC2 domain-containing protein [Gemmatimonadales bacterium]